MAGTRRGREQNKKEIIKEEANPTPSRKVFTSFLNYRHLHHQAAEQQEGSKKKCKKIGCSGSLCNLRENSKITLRPEAAFSSESCKRSRSRSSTSMKATLSEINEVPSSSTTGGSLRGMHLKSLSGCYGCHMVVDPVNAVFRDSSLRAAICSCQKCGQIFMKPESLELHQTIRHAVSELGLEDSSRKIVEIIFQSSWLKKQAPTCKIDRILKIHNSKKTIARFEDYRNTIKSKASKLPKKHSRSIADGNELLRFHCTTLTCSLGLKGSTNLCSSILKCKICSILRDGIKTDAQGRIKTMATSGRAHDFAQISLVNEKRGMLVCRVIAGRVKRNQESSEDFDSLLSASGMSSSLDELCVFNPEAILPCFVVIYRVF